MSRRVKAILTYDGTGYHGWQVQPGLPTIQSTLESVLAEIEGAAVTVMGSGRTDAGVHALAQVAAFDLRNRIPAANLQRAMNRLLPPAIRILSIEDADPGFHPRFDASAKTYEYRIHREEICPPFDWPYVAYHPYPLDEDKMTAAAEGFTGTHNFTAFAASDPKDALGLSKVRTVFSSHLSREGARLIYRVRGNGFLKHMVRNLTGALIEIGKGNLDEAALRALLAGTPRPPIIRTAPAKGLFLVSVEYGRRDPAGPVPAAPPSACPPVEPASR
ncbi:MAG: tRNA pseudouridine(38-40) synthase TruA [Bryobacterales bacterium]|nr:tRNA pseudouridine(38-40) synthase TruA [Bryobacterales bacterium]